MGHETLRTGGKILTDIVERIPTDTTTAGDIVSKYVTESAQNLTSKLQSRGCKCAHCDAEGGRKMKKKNSPKRAPGKVIKRDIIPSFASANFQQPIMSATA